jgi:pyruvate/2-oxoglutarate dehydrogenase complex dihydrolipoamide dehydrogenase (E3) component
MSARSETDLCVIGGGSAGLSVASGAVQMGARVVLIEGHKMGGDCLNYGCVPSKALLAAAKHAHAMTTGGPFGIAPVPPQVDFGAVKDHVEAVIAGIAPHDSVERFAGLGVDVIEGHARFVSPTEVAAGERIIAARRFVIATGSRPFVPPIPGLADVPHFTNETIFALRERPEHLIVIGGGPIGMEMAQAHRRLGSRVTVIEGARALGKDDPELAAIALERLRGEGIAILEEQGAESVSAAGDGIAVTTADGTVHVGSHLLVAVGRKANTDDLGLEAAGIETTRTGVKVDASLKTTNRRVYAIGDAAGGLQFTHVAGYQAGIVVRSALFGLPAKAATKHIPWATYTDPELAAVGMSEAEARKAHGRNLEVLRFDYAENDRARTEGLTTGRIKVMVVKGRPVGAGIVGAQAGELIGLWALAISAKLKVSDIAGMVVPYPTLTEVSKRAAGQYYVPRLFANPTVKKIVGLVQKFR